MRSAVVLASLIATALLLPACEDRPPPGPPPEVGKLEPIEKTAKGIERSEKIKKKPVVDRSDVNDDGLRLRWKVPEGEPAQAFRLTARPSRRGSYTTIKLNHRLLPRLSRKKQGALQELIQLRLPSHYTLTGVVRVLSEEYKTTAVEYVLGRLKRKHLPRNKAMAKALKKAQGKVLVRAELGENGAVLGVDSQTKGDYNMQLVLLEMPQQRVSKGDSWNINLRAFTHVLFEQDSLDEKGRVTLVDVRERDDQVLAVLKYDVRLKQTGAFQRIGPKPVRQTIELTFKGKGVFDVTRGCWKSMAGRYRMVAKGLVQYTEDQKLKIRPLKKVPKSLLAAE